MLNLSTFINDFLHQALPKPILAFKALNMLVANFVFIAIFIICVLLVFIETLFLSFADRIVGKPLEHLTIIFKFLIVVGAVYLFNTIVVHQTKMEICYLETVFPTH